MYHPILHRATKYTYSSIILYYKVLLCKDFIKAFSVRSASEKTVDRQSQIFQRAIFFSFSIRISSAKVWVLFGDSHTSRKLWAITSKETTIFVAVFIQRSNGILLCSSACCHFFSYLQLLRGVRSQCPVGSCRLQAALSSRWPGVVGAALEFTADMECGAEWARKLIHDR